MVFGVSHGIAGGTSMVRTPVELVNSAYEGIIPIDEIRRDSRLDGLFTTIADVLDSVRTTALPGNLLFLVVEPLQGLEGLGYIGALHPRTGSTAMVSGGR